MKRFYQQRFLAGTLITICLGLGSATLWADVAVIVNPNAGIDKLEEKDINRIFLGKIKSFPNGESAVPVDQDAGQPARDSFNSKILQKDDAQLKSYWSRLIFTGKGTPPKENGGDEEVKKLVASNPNIIGYIDASKVDSSVKAVFIVN